MKPSRHRPLLHLAALIGTLGTAAPGAAQVGHDPATSPYRDIRRSTFLVLSGGRFLGSGGAVGVAPHGGNVYGLRMSFLANRTIQLSAGGFYGMLSRSIYDPAEPADERIVGTTDTDVLWIDAAIHFNLTGGKTWHRLAPFAGAAAGLAFSENLPDDPASFKMGTKFFLAPVLGVRFFLGQRLALQAESRFNFWQIKYTTAFVQEAIESSEWSVSPWLNLGLAWAFDWPF
ncbi:MAG TPA: hypothetical protein VGA78_18910 [Gemmatimonadales bacterium]